MLSPFSSETVPLSGFPRPRLSPRAPGLFLGSLFCLGGIFPVSAQIQINEISAATNERILRFDSLGQPHVGVGPSWFEEAFNDSAWLTGSAPLGLGVSGLVTDLSPEMYGLASSLYARKSFTVSASQATSSLILRLKTDCRDGYVIYLNGKEVARSRLGPAKMFTYADATAFSLRATTGFETVDLGPASSLLKTGTNILAVHAVGAALDAKGAVKLEVGLELVGATSATTLYTQNFSNANGSLVTHANVAGSVTNVTTGSIPAGSWLALSPPVESSPLWQNFSVVSTLETSAGVSGSGGISYEIKGTGPKQDAYVRGPSFSASPKWTAGSVALADLDLTTLGFSYKMTPGMVADLLLEPVDGPLSSSLELGTLPPAPPVSSGIVGYWRFDETNASDGATLATALSQINSSTLNAVPVNSPKYSSDVPGPRIFDPVTGITYENRFSLNSSGASARASVANNPLLNTESFTFEFFIKLVGEPSGFDSFASRAVIGTGDSATSSQRNAWQIDFDHSLGGTTYGRIRSRWDTPGTPPPDFNRAIAGTLVFADTPSGNGLASGYGASADVYTEGDGFNDAASAIWHHVAVSYNGANRQVTIYNDYVARATFTLNTPFIHPAAALNMGKLGTGAYGLLIDEARYSGRVLTTAEMLRVQDLATPLAYSTFSASLGTATPSSRTAFLASLNGGSSTAFRPVLRVRPESFSEAGKTLYLDDVTLIHEVPASLTSLVPTGSAVSYFVGVGEPSGGLYDPALPRSPNNPSQSNQVAAFPDTHDFVDWVELKNSGPQPVELSGWSLSDQTLPSSAWAFPSGTSIPAGGHLVVLCDENHDVPGITRLHANFKLGDGGETIRLYEGGLLRDEFTFPRQDRHHTFGRSPVDGSPVFFNISTPGRANASPAATERCSTPDFSLAGGFYTGSQTLTISTVTAGASLRYTSDGSEPLATSTLYVGPITVSPGVNDKTGRVIRARAFKNGAVTSPIRSATFLINQNTAIQGVPAMCFTGEATRDFFKDYGLLAINGGAYDATAATWSGSAPTDYNMALMHGRAFERPIFLEYHRADGLPGFAENAGLRYAGSPHARPRMKLTQTASSPWPASSVEKPSFNLFFRSDYGASELNYPFLGLDYPVNSFDELRPRAGKNDVSNPFIRDELVRRTFRSMGHASVNGVINTLYVNGSYKGFYNTVERYRERFFTEHFGSSAEWDIRIIDTPEVGDSIAWNEMKTAVAMDLSVQANLDAALAHLDLDEMIDYYLLNAYLATWDWPNNNWVASRERTADGRWRFHVWDAEGGFGNVTTKPTNYDTIGTDLRTNSGIGTGSVSQIFRGLYASPEVRLRFADRINHWFFNGNVLDDRDPVNCRIAKLKDQLKLTFAPLLTYTHGSTFNEAFWNNWTTATTANPNAGAWTVPLSNRRSFLFNTDNLPTTDISFRSHGLWPATEPVTFSQHGGKITSAFRLTLAANTTAPVGSTIYYTLDGTDPRLTGGAVASGARVYSSALALPAPLARVTSRVRNSNTGEWSALTLADFLTDTQTASATNFLVSQIHYHPTNPTATETAAGFLADEEFEFLELMAVGTSAVDLSAVKIIAGITFDFSSSPFKALAPGQRVLLVKNRAAFLLRHGSGLAGNIAGEYTGTLSNSGEQIWITGADGADVGTEADTISQFSYSDNAPWPTEPDGAGPSLVLMNPAGRPDPNLAASWRASVSPAASPGSGDGQSFASWAVAKLIPGAVSSGDGDGDGLPNLLEYALGHDPLVASNKPIPAALLQPLLVNGVPESYLTLTLTRPLGLDDLTWEVQCSSSLGSWSPAVLFVSIRNPDGTETLTYRHPQPVGNTSGQFLRIVVTGP